MSRKRSRAKKCEATAAIANGTNAPPAPSSTNDISTGLELLKLQDRDKPHKRDIVSEFNDYFGTVSNLANWQMLCRDVGVEEELTSITQCRKELRGVWVNIYDLIDARNAGLFPQRFPTQRVLSEYTMRTKRIFPKKRAKKGGPVSALLAHIFC